MALNDLLDFPKTVSLTPDSGVQFLDFGFSLRKGAADLPEDWGYEGGPPRAGVRAPLARARRGDEVIAGTKERYSIDWKMIVEMFHRAWVPLPLLRKPGHRFDPGPTNWARAYLVKLREPDVDGNDYRLVLALDTTLLAHVDGEVYLAPTPGDARAGSSFELPGWKDDAEWFYEQDWVREWCFELYKEMEQRRDPNPKRYTERPMSEQEVLERMSGANEHVARYRSLVDLLFSLDILPQLTLPERNAAHAPPIDVDLVLDLGNSRSCGLLIEADRDDTGVDVTKAAKLQVRDLGMAEQVYSDPFPSRFEFARAEIGRQHLSMRSGRLEAFAWPTVVRVGVEAARLAAQRSGTEGATGMSSPKRYLWDEDEWNKGAWRFNVANAGIGVSDSALGVAFTTFINDVGEPLHRVPGDALETDPGRGLQAIAAKYSRRNLTAFALAEIFVQACSMMNSPMHRHRRYANRDRPRRLSRIILTMPTAMPIAERRILEEQSRNACDLAYLSMKLADVQVGDDGASTIVYKPAARLDAARNAGPEVLLKWDEATATQAVYLYTQVAINYAGDARKFFADMRHPENAAEAEAGRPLPDFRLATLDVGGGTSDLVVTSIGVKGQAGAHVTMEPEQVFREGFNIAGDDALLAVVRDHVVGRIRRTLLAQGLGERADHALNRLIGADDHEKTAMDYVRRQQFAAQVAAPIGLALLQACEGYDPLGPAPVVQRAFGEFFTPADAPSADLVGYFDSEMSKHLGQAFRLADVRFDVDLPAVDQTIRNVFRVPLMALAEMVWRQRCDLLILSGRTSRLPAVRALLEESGALPGHRIVSMHQFRVGRWYPFVDHRAMVGDPKTTAAVGAMICLLGNGRLQNFNFRSNNLRPRSTARYFGKLDPEGRLRADDVFYSDLDLEHADIPGQRPFEFHGPMPLGFRQLPVAWWPGTRLYFINYRTQADADELSQKTPLSVELKRVSAESIRDPRTGERVFPNPDLTIKSVRASSASVQDEEGNLRLRLRLQTLIHEDGYWLDTGVLFGS